MDDKTKKYFYDIQESIKSIDPYLSGKRIFEDYLKNKMLRRAIEREFEIIGEAMTKLNQIDPEIPISSKKQIIGMRNRVIHGYDRIDHEIVWGTIIRHLPVLQSEIEDLLG